MLHCSLIYLLDELTILSFFIVICLERVQFFQKMVVQPFQRKAYRPGFEKHVFEIKLNIQQKTQEFVNDNFVSSLFES